MSVYVTGDTHGYMDVGKITPSRWQESNNLKETDTLIICGDFGFIWDNSFTDRWWMEWFLRRPYITCFSQGNHENHVLLGTYPVVDFHGGKARKINDHVYSLMQGEMYEFDGKKFFNFGKADSHDKASRVAYESWWPEEMPSDEEYAHGIETMKAYDYKCDFIISHCAPNKVVDKISNETYKHDALTDYLQESVANKMHFGHWYFGHYHMDKDVDIKDGNKYTCCYQKIYKVV